MEENINPIKQSSSNEKNPSKEDNKDDDIEKIQPNLINSSPLVNNLDSNKLRFNPLTKTCPTSGIKMNPSLLTGKTCLNSVSPHNITIISSPGLIK